MNNLETRENEQFNNEGYITKLAPLKGLQIATSTIFSLPTWLSHLPQLPNRSRRCAQSPLLPAAPTTHPPLILPALLHSATAATFGCETGENRRRFESSVAAVAQCKRLTRVNSTTSFWSLRALSSLSSSLRGVVPAVWLLQRFNHLLRLAVG